jgi:hypothetical protein
MKWESFFIWALFLLFANRASALTWVAENTPTTNTLLLYHANEGSGTNVTDASTNNRNSTLTRDCFAVEGANSWLGSGAGTYLSGISSTNSNGDYIHTVLATNVNWNKGLTISFWYRVRDEVGSPNANSMFYLNGPVVVPRVYMNTDTFGAGNNGRLNFTDTQGPGTDLSTGNINYGTNHVWRHIALVYDAGGDASNGGTWSFYLDNMQTGTVINATQNLTGVSTFDIRFMSGLFSTNGMSADFDEILIENAVLTDFSGPNTPSAGDGDADNDGIPDDLEIIWCGGDCDPNALTSAGNYTYLEVFVLDSTPESTNIFNVDAISIPSAVSLRFESTNSRVYAVEFNTNLLDVSGSAWTALAPAQPGSNGVHSVADPTAEARRNYRVKVQLP